MGLGLVRVRAAEGLGRDLGVVWFGFGARGGRKVVLLGVLCKILEFSHFEGCSFLS